MDALFLILFINDITELSRVQLTVLKLGQKAPKVIAMFVESLRIGGHFITFIVKILDICTTFEW